MTTSLLKKLVEFLLSSILFAAPAFAFATEKGVTIEHNSPGKIGSWVLYYPGGVLKNDDINVNKKKQTVYPKPGELTLNVDPPAGATLTISAYKDDELLKKQTSRQLSVTSEDGHAYRFYVQYAFTEQGTLGITSTPNNVFFRMKGPDGKGYTGRTPKTFTALYAGRYTINANAMPGCLRPRPMTKQLRSGDRVVVHLELPCDLDSRKISPDRPIVSRRAMIKGIDDEAAARAKKRLDAQKLMQKAAQ